MVWYVSLAEPGCGRSDAGGLEGLDEWTHNSIEGCTSALDGVS